MIKLRPDTWYSYREIKDNLEVFELVRAHDSKIGAFLWAGWVNIMSNPAGVDPGPEKIWIRAGYQLQKKYPKYVELGKGNFE